MRLNTPKPDLKTTEKVKVPYQTRDKMPKEAFEHLKENDEHLGVYL